MRGDGCFMPPTPKTTARSVWHRFGRQYGADASEEERRRVGGVLQGLMRRMSSLRVAVVEVEGKVEVEAEGVATIIEMTGQTEAARKNTRRAAPVAAIS